MRKSTMQVFLTASILIFSSLAGCLGTDDDDDVTIMTSTYHVGQLVSAIVGDTMDVEVLSPSNVPVHDYEPSAADLVRLKDSEMFFYHGLGLETWVDATLDMLGDDKPTSFATHALPTGESALDYEGILLRELCEHLAEGPYETSELSDEEGHADDVELHAEHVTHTITFPGHDGHDDHADDDHDDHADDDHADDDHDDHDHAEDDHADDDHDDHDHAEDDHADHSDHEDHDDHGDHDDHNHAEPMEKIEQVTGCPEDTVVYIYELEEGEYVVEFETEDEDHSTFNMVALKMGGAHAHHDHGDHDDHGDDHSDHGDDHSDHDDHGDDHSDHGDDHSDHDDHAGDDHDDHDEELTPEMALEMFDTNNDSMLSWDEFMESMEDDHDEHESDMVCYDMTLHAVNESYANQTDCEAAGLMWTESSGHDDHDEEEVYQAIWNESDTNMDGNLNVTELEHFIHEMEELDREEGVGYAVIHIEAEGEYGFAIPHDVEMFILMEGDAHEGHDDHDDHGDDHSDHDDHGDDDHDDHGDEEALAYDPHSWLDPVAFKAQASFVLEELKKAYPDLADTFQSNADAFMMSLDKIDSDYKAAFGDGGTCTKNSVAANHNAYAYVAYRYDIEFVTVHGLDPEGEPSAADIAKVVEKIGDDEISVLFVEEYTDVTAVNSIVDQTKSSTMPDGVSVLTLYTMELPPKDSNDDYLSLMQKNLDNLKTGLSC